MLDINNPGNIRFNPNIKWQGQTAMAYQGFVWFYTAHDGLRALAKVLHSYMFVDGCKSLQSYIERWAPAEENDTAIYLANVSNWSGFTPDHYITPGDVPILMGCITRQENGSNPYDQATIQAAFDDAWEN